MNKIKQLLYNNTKGILAVRLIAGYPTLNSAISILKELELKGVNMAEINIPSCELTDLDSITQNASDKALENGISIKLIFEQLRNVRHHVKMPLILSSDFKSIVDYGFENFCRKCVACSIDGIAIPDIPFNEYQEKYRIMAERYSLKIIMQITPETSEEKIQLIDRYTDGFIYLVGSDSSNGEQKHMESERKSYFKKIKEMNLQNPTMIGYGISNKTTFKAACENSSGAIVKSKFVSLLGEEADIAGSIDKLLAQLKD